MRFSVDVPTCKDWILNAFKRQGSWLLAPGAPPIHLGGGQLETIPHEVYTEVQDWLGRLGLTLVYDGEGPVTKWHGRGCLPGWWVRGFTR